MNDGQDKTTGRNIAVSSHAAADKMLLLQIIQSGPTCFPFSFFCVTQVSGSKLWQTERSCMCCQESGEREATVSLLCPKAAPGEPRLRRV